MKLTSTAAAVIAIAAGLWAIDRYTVAAQVYGNDNNVSVMDTCDPADGAWEPTGGCGLKPHQGDVSGAEFFALLRSPLTIPPNGALIGHPAWRSEPAHVTSRTNAPVRVTNRGGRGHTYTEVANFGGGFIAPLNIGLTPAPECASAVALPPGSTQVLTLGPGLHKFQCCIHPWMRGTVRVE